MSEPVAKNLSLTVPCPSCRKLCRYDASNAFRPFCSKRCKNDDIISWATESYRLPEEHSEPVDENADSGMEPKGGDDAGDQ